MVNKQVSEFINAHLFLVCTTLALGYFVFSFFSEGFYQHDEAAHFTNMLRIWHHPEMIMGNWAKPGFKLIYAPVALLGINAVKLLNCGFAAASSVIGYKVMQQLGYRKPWLVLILLALQPFWIELSFRNYSETFTAFLLISAVWFFYEQSYWLAALFMSYILTIRQEFYPIVGLFGLFLLYKKQWVAAGLLIVFPFVQHIAGWLIYQNPMYLYDSIFGFSGDIQQAYPRQGGAHYFLMSLPVFGGIVFAFFIAFLIQGFAQRKTLYYPILIPVIIFFLIHVLFSIETFKIGPSTGGNLRYLMVIAPLVAVLAAIGAERIYELQSWKERSKYLWVMVPLIALAILFMSYEHNHLKYTYKRDFRHILILILTVEVIVLGLHQKWISRSIIGVTILSVILTVHPLSISDEDRVVQNAAKVIEEIYTPGTQLIMSHSLFPYYLNMIQEDFEPPAKQVLQEIVENAEAGSIIIWDAHYSFKPRRNPNTLPLDYFLEKPDQFMLIEEPMFTENEVFSIYFFKKN